MKLYRSRHGRIIPCVIGLLLLFAAAAPSFLIHAQTMPPGSYQTESNTPEISGASPESFTPLCSAIPRIRHIPAPPRVVDGPDWVVVATQLRIEDPDWGPATSYNAFHMVNTWTNATYGPFLVEELNPVDPETGLHTPGGLFDVAVTPDGKTALMSDFGASKVFFVDLSRPLEPAYLGSLVMTTDPTNSSAIRIASSSTLCFSSSTTTLRTIFDAMFHSMLVHSFLPQGTADVQAARDTHFGRGRIGAN